MEGNIILEEFFCNSIIDIDFLMSLIFSEATIDLIKTLLTTQLDKTQTTVREVQKTTETELETRRKEAEQRLAEHEQRRQDVNSQLVGKR